MSTFKNILDLAEINWSEEFEKGEEWQNCEPKYRRLQEFTKQIIQDYNGVDVLLHPKLEQLFDYIFDYKKNPEAKEWVNQVINTTIHNSIWLYEEHLEEKGLEIE